MNSVLSVVLPKSDDSIICHESLQVFLEILGPFANGEFLDMDDILIVLIQLGKALDFIARLILLGNIP